MYSPFGSGAPPLPTGETTSRSVILGVLEMGLPVSVTLPLGAGGGTLEPCGDRLPPGDRRTWLLTMSMGMSRMLDSLPRRQEGQRTAMSKIFSPSIMEDRPLPPRAVCTTL